MAKKYRYVPWLMLLPVLLIRGFTSLYPVILSFRNSLFNMSLLNRGKERFIGFQNFVDMTKDPALLQSFGFTLEFTVVSMAFHLLLGVLLAVLLNCRFKGRKFMRTMTLIPWAMPMIVAGQLAKFAFNDTYGFINDIIRRVVPDFSYNWLIYSNSAQAAVIVTDLWKDIPYFSILILSALQFIRQELYEAARIDGAGPVKAFWYITIPGIMRTLLSITVFFTLWRMTNFDLVYAMTGGGPGNSTSLIAYRIYTAAFSSLNMGYASAIGVVLFTVMTIVALLCTKSQKWLGFDEE